MTFDPGYSVYESILTSIDCDSLINALGSSISNRSRAGARHLMSTVQVSELARDSRLVEIAARMLGRIGVPYRATLFEKTGRANWLVVWHQDTALPLRESFDAPDWGPWSTKAGITYAHAPAWALSRIVALRVHLDASTLENGPLRVIPGSHNQGVLTDDELSAIYRREPHVSCLVPRGGVLAMRPLLMHASSKARSDEPRRVLHIEYADSLDLDEGITLAVA